MRLLIAFILVGCIFTVGSSAHAQGYSIVGKRFEIRTEEEWNAWTFPKGTVDVLPDGVVRPAFFSKSVDAVLDAQSFTHYVPSLFYPEFAELAGKSTKELTGHAYLSGGIKDAGSNLEDALNAMDGDIHTYWQPDPNDVLKRWWIEVDLGRLVFATRIVLRFVEEGEGDPFLRFKVFVARGEKPYYGAERMGWRQVYQSVGRNYDQRVVEIEVGPERPRNMEGEGALVQYVRVAVLDTRGERAAIVLREEYASLPQQFRGPLVYYRKTPFGEEEEREISHEGYEKLPKEEQGRVAYYRKELPRLAEVEVWTLGDNLSLGIGRRGGSVRTTAGGGSLGDEAVDGMYTTWERIGSYTSMAPKMSVLVDLGCSFWVDTFRLVASPWQGVPHNERTSHIRGYEIEGSDGTRASEGGLLWRTVTTRWELDSWRLPSKKCTEDRFTPQKLRFFNMRFPSAFTGLEYWGQEILFLSEFQVYGEGYVPELTLTSPFIESGWTKMLGHIRWEGETPPGTSIEIRTRSGSDVRSVERFFDKGGGEITEQQWHDLPFLWQGSVITEFQPTRWSAWSKPYKEPGEWVTSPTPSLFFQVQVRLLSDDPYAYPSIRSISMDYFDPLVREIVGEIVPYRVSQAGKRHTYSCLLRCTYHSQNLGFDGIVLRSPYPVDMQLVGVRRGTAEQIASGNALALSSENFTLVPAERDSIWIQFPSALKPVRHNVFGIRFSAEVFLKGTSFEVFLVNSARPGAQQRVRTGDAVEFAESEEMRVMVPVEGGTIGDVWVQPEVFSPNGDGINDEVEIGFSVFNVDVARRVSVDILDLGGRVVWKLQEVRDNVSGRHTVKWDGNSEDGRRVLPGVYLVRIRVDADSRLVAENKVVVRTVCVAY